MNDTSAVSGGFDGDPEAALSVAGASSCCGNPAQATLTVPVPLPEPAATGGPYCGTTTEAAAENSCCGSAAKADAVAAGRGCCG